MASAKGAATRSRASSRMPSSPYRNPVCSETSTIGLRWSANGTARRFGSKGYAQSPNLIRRAVLEYNLAVRSVPFE